MCGICGQLCFNSRCDARTIERMMARMAPRGPDGHGSWMQDNIGFGHRRLAIIDLSDQGRQPMVDGEWALTFNGCIYNYRSVRDELVASGAVFHSSSDTEVILKGWQQWGEGCLQRIDGMFAFALWNPVEKMLYLGRDRVGIKPLYYTVNAHSLRFASALPALLASGDVDVAIDREALQFLFTLHAVIPAPGTIISGVRKLPPAHYLAIDAQGRSQLHRYWELSTATVSDEEEWQRCIEDGLYRAVEKRMLAADVPVGILLSGGIDSSLIVALAEEVRRSTRSEEMPELMTFSIGFDAVDDEQGSEFEYSDQVVSRFNTIHHKLRVPNATVLERLPEAIEAMSEPMFGQDAVAFFLLAEQVSQHVKVVLSGQGADEVFGGYFWYRQMLSHDQRAPQAAAVDKFAPYYFDRDFDELQDMLVGDWQIGDRPTQWIDQHLQGEGGFLDRVLGLDVTTLIVDDPVKRVDNMTMAFSLEARVPFLDTHVIEAASRSDASWRLSSGGKHPLKKIARRYFPQHFVDRRKGYFPVPALKHIRGPFLEWIADVLHSSACRNRGIYRRSYIDALLREPQKDSHYTRLQGSKLWHAALLEAWLQTHLPR